MVQPYSEDHKVPTIAKFEEQDQANMRQSETQTKSNGKPPADDANDEKKEMMDRMQANKKKPTDRVTEKGARTVRDPVTGSDVVIKDADFKAFENAADGKGMDRAALDPTRHDVNGPSTIAPPTKSGADEPADSVEPVHAAPNPAGPGNILLQRLPPAVEMPRTPVDQTEMMLTVGFVAIWIMTAFGHGFKAWLLRTSLIGAVGFVSIMAVGLAANKMEKEMNRVRMNMHRQRGQEFAPPTPESVEWLNSFLKVIWGLVNSDMFIPIADQIEDVMQQSLPGFINAVKISDIGQGTNPFRIISMRALPDQPGDREYPRKEWIQGKEGKDQDISKEEREKDGQQEDEEDAGDYVNYEVSFSYQALPGQGGSLMTKNIHLMLEFFMGVWDWLHIPIPIWVQVEGIVGTVRLRIQFIPQPPFVRNLTITLMGVPGVDVSVQPMTKVLPNLLDLPVISSFVKMAIKAATAEFVAPKSMTLNLEEMLTGPGVDSDTHAIGVLLVTIHYCADLSAQDKNGSSDPYIVAAYAKFGKPLYSTRIVLGDLNPVFEETFAILVSEDEVKSKEDFTLMLWDSDQRSADDLIGRVQLPLSELMVEPNKLTRRTDKLTGFEDKDDMPGTVHWSVGYFEKPPFRESERHIPPKDPKAPVLELAGEQNLERYKAPADPKAPVLEMAGEENKKAKKVAKDEPLPPLDVFNARPDPLYPSGVLALTIHQVNQLERQNLKGASGGDREGRAGQDTGNPNEYAENLPSGYVEFIVNDEMVYKTRVKPYSSYPFFEARHEMFIRDWRNTIVRFVVRDSRLREKDPILGVVNINLADLFESSSMVKQLFSLTEGVGFGRASCSLLFRSVKAELPREMIGWETGTFEVLSNVRLQVSDEFREQFANTRLTISTSESNSKLPGKLAHIDGDEVVFDVDKDIRLPLYDRYSSAALFQLGKGEHMAALWLQDLVDDEEKEVRIPLLMCKNFKQLRQNYINEQTGKTHDYSVIGHLIATVRLDSGLDPDHEKYAQDPITRHVYETYDHVEGQAAVAETNSHAMDDGTVDKKEKKAMERAHEKQLRSRHRGVMQFAPVRTAVWMKEGMKERSRSLKKKITGDTTREPAIKSEA